MRILLFSPLRKWSTLNHMVITATTEDQIRGVLFEVPGSSLFGLGDLWMRVFVKITLCRREAVGSDNEFMSLVSFMVT